MTTGIKRSAKDYHTAWIAALPIERSAASEMLDNVHEEPEDFGRIHSHNLVITSLPAAIYGKANAAHTVTELLASLPHIKIGLLVGIGADLPSAQHDIRLGDVVVSQPDGSHGGVIQYDLGKANADGSWEPKGFLQPPPIALLKALSNLQAKHESGYFRLTGFLAKAMECNKFWAQRYAYPAGKGDCLYRSKRLLDGGFKSYTEEGELIRPQRSTTNPSVHFGTIASGDTLVKNALARDDIPAKVQQICLCIEMEAAGLLSKFPCMVIRGICDYADSHKTDDWQRYAAATAAAFAKELLLYVPTAELQQSRNAADLMGLQKAVEKLTQSIDTTLRDSNASELLIALYTCPYAERKDRNIDALDGTCQWFVQHARFLNWNNRVDAGLLWVSADPGCGKSVLAKYLIDKVLCVDKDQIICYFFFKDDFTDQRSCSNAMCALLRQLLIQRPELRRQEVFLKFAQDGDKLLTSFKVLWDLFIKLCSSLTDGVVICVLDALDECQQSDRVLLIHTITQSYCKIQKLRIKFLITSRPYGEIKDDFYKLVTDHPTIHLSGESELEAEQISGEIDIVIRHRIHLLSKRRSLTQREEAYLIAKFTSVPHRTYLWAYLTMDIIETTPGLTRGHLEQVLGRLPQTVYEAYEKILNRSSDIKRTRLLLQIMVAAQKPLSLQGVSLLLNMQEHHRVEDFADIVEPPFRFKQSVRDLCGLFVIVVNNQVYFLHQTAREFLSHTSVGFSYDVPPDFQRAGLVKTSNRWAESIKLVNSHRTMVDRCLWFLFTEGARSYDEGFFQYCNNFWNFHYAGAGQFDEDAPQTELALCIFTAWIELPESRLSNASLDLVMRYYQNCDPRFCSPIVFAACFRFHSVVKLILRRELHPQRRIRKASSGLWWAVLPAVEDLPLIRLLLSYGANPNANRYGDLESSNPNRTRHWTTPLTIAIQHRKARIVRLLVEGGADVNMMMSSLPRDVYLTTPLGFLVDNFDKRFGDPEVDILKTLLAHGADCTIEYYLYGDFLSDHPRPILSTPLQTFRHISAKISLYPDTKRRLKGLLLRI